MLQCTGHPDSMLHLVTSGACLPVNLPVTWKSGINLAVKTLKSTLSLLADEIVRIICGICVENSVD